MTREELLTIRENAISSGNSILLILVEDELMDKDYEEASNELSLRLFGSSKK